MFPPINPGRGSPKVKPPWAGFFPPLGGVFKHSEKQKFF